MEYYNWILAFHVMSFISWMAMLFYLPRLYVYHTEFKDNYDFVEVVKIQEEKLYKFIGIPAFWATILSGGALIVLNPALFKSGIWLHIKLTAVIFLILYHLSLGYFRKKLLNDECTKSGKFFRVYNEVPTILMIIIVIMVVIKPI
ncbi:protoporphyrinogen oxidase HemJ [Nitrosophilus kaiyonis]|uniref:protoporphyrinogen oxidase HemJ n=1 Tax=Nitrosophilus kaiyonis TaxID=2930200 RepID=UPI002492E515|nr:protoporphyrinogen oxidase HemJ [Nitrosophilus kaiyonis]